MNTLLDWIGDITVSTADREAILIEQSHVLLKVGRYGSLGPTFVSEAQSFALLRHAFLLRLLASNSSAEAIPFVTSHDEILKDLLKQGRGVIVAMAKTGFWISVPFWVARNRIRQACLFQGMPASLLAIYERLGLQTIHVRPPITLALEDGRRLLIPTSNPISDILSALRSNMAVGILADTYRGRGKEQELLGQRVRLIDHYAQLSFRAKSPLLYLRQWISDEAIHMDFIPICIEPGTKSSQPERLVRDFVELLRTDLQIRPHQYAYGKDSTFANA